MCMSVFFHRDCCAMLQSEDRYNSEVSQMIYLIMMCEFNISVSPATSAWTATIIYTALTLCCSDTTVCFNPLPANHDNSRFQSVLLAN